MFYCCILMNPVHTPVPQQPDMHSKQPLHYSTVKEKRLTQQQTTKSSKKTFQWCLPVPHRSTSCAAHSHGQLPACLQTAAQRFVGQQLWTAASLHSRTAAKFVATALHSSFTPDSGAKFLRQPPVVSPCAQRMPPPQLIAHAAKLV